MCIFAQCLILICDSNVKNLSIFTNQPTRVEVYKKQVAARRYVDSPSEISLCWHATVTADSNNMLFQLYK